MKHYYLGEKCGLLIRLESFWIGIHYSKYAKRTCINILPCITFYIGQHPKQM